MRPVFPTIEQVLQLENLLERTIPENWQDQNGHVNIQYYQTLYDRSGWVMFNQLGVDQNYFSERKLGMFDLEHHIYYLSELHVGDTVSMHGRFVARNHKRVHGVIFIVNKSRRLLSCTLEFITTGANLQTRRTDRFPDDISENLDRAIVADSDILWPTPICGAMSV